MRTTKQNLMWSEILKKPLNVVEEMTQEEIKDALALELLKDNYIVENIGGGRINFYKDY